MVVGLGGEEELWKEVVMVVQGAVEKVREMWKDTAGLLRERVRGRRTEIETERGWESTSGWRRRRRMVIILRIRHTHTHTQSMSPEIRFSGEGAHRL